MAEVKAAVIGYPVEHSLSPLIHNFWIDSYGLSGSYGAIAIEPENLEQGIKALVAGGYAGFNVTLPHKIAVVPLCASLDEAARAIGAVNTVKIDPEGALQGYNTDAYGFWQALVAACPDRDFTARPALVLGAGGAARAVCYALGAQGVKNILVANRTREKAETLAESFDGWAVPWAEREIAAREAGLIVNATSLGMKGKQALKFSLNYAHAGATVCDIVYAPRQTQLLKAAQARGFATVGGLGMLLHQARPAFEKWFGVLPEVNAALYEKIKEKP